MLFNNHKTQLMYPDLKLPAIIKERRSFILITGAIFILILIMQFINNRFLMNDFQVYYYAAKAMVNNTQVYGLAFGGSGVGFYKYSPFALFYFIPLSFLPLQAAKIVFFIIISVAITSAFIIAANIIQHASKREKSISIGMLFVTFLIASSQLHRELHLGNVNMILLLLLLLMLKFILSGKQISAGIIFSIVLFIKPHFIILVPLFALRKQYKLLFVTLSGVIIEVILPALIVGISRNMVLHNEWIQTMQAHNDTLNTYYNTIYSLFFLVFKQLPVNIFPFPEKVVVIGLVIIVALVFGWFCLINIRKEKIMQIQQVGQSIWIEFLILVALVPNLVNTDTEHFLLSIPLIIYLMGLMNKNTPLWFKISVIFSLFLYGINIHDLVGNTFSNWLSVYGILGLGNLLIIILSSIGYRMFELKGNTITRTL